MKWETSTYLSINCKFYHFHPHLILLLLHRVALPRDLEVQTRNGSYGTIIYALYLMSKKKSRIWADANKTARNAKKSERHAATSRNPGRQKNYNSWWHHICGKQESSMMYSKVNAWVPQWTVCWYVRKKPPLHFHLSLTMNQDMMWGESFPIHTVTVQRGRYEYYHCMPQDIQCSI